MKFSSVSPAMTLSPIQNYVLIQGWAIDADQNSVHLIGAALHNSPNFSYSPIGKLIAQINFPPLS